MKLAAALALLALAAPALAQHGGAHAGSFSSHPAAGHSGFSNSGFAHSSIAPSRFSAPAFRYANPGVRRFAPPGSAAFRAPNATNRFSGSRPAYRSGFANPSRPGNHRGEGDRFRERRRDFRNWYASIYPVYPGYAYPYTLDPGFFDWGSNDYETPDNSAANLQPGYSEPAGPDYGPGYPAPYPDLSQSSEPRPQYAAAAAPPSAPGEPLTLIFKGGRDPVKVQNYMMTATVLTDLDPQHYEKIPLDQIDLAATQRANTAAGVDFEIPAASRN